MKKFIILPILFLILIMGFSFVLVDLKKTVREQEAEMARLNEEIAALNVQTGEQLDLLTEAENRLHETEELNQKLREEGGIWIQKVEELEALLQSSSH